MELLFTIKCTLYLSNNYNFFCTSGTVDRIGITARESMLACICGSRLRRRITRSRTLFEHIIRKSGSLTLNKIFVSTNKMVCFRLYTGKTKREMLKKKPHGKYNTLAYMRTKALLLSCAGKSEAE